MRTDAVRGQIQELLRARPFRPFVIVLESGDRIPIGHPENIAFDPGSNGVKPSQDFYVLTAGLRMFSTFDAVASVALLDRGEAS